MCAAVIVGYEIWKDRHFDAGPVREELLDNVLGPTVLKVSRRDRRYGRYDAGDEYLRTNGKPTAGRSSRQRHI